MSFNANKEKATSAWLGRFLGCHPGLTQKKVRSNTPVAGFNGVEVGCLLVY